MGIQLWASACSDKGCVRQNNEDSFCLNGFYLEKQNMDQGGLFKCHVLPDTLFAVCDGMGGEEAGEEASLLSVKLCAEFLKTPEKWAERNNIESFLYSSCKAVYDQAKLRGNRSGATLALTLMNKDGVRVANMGDSRIYRLHRGKMRQISYDHTEIHQLLLQGKIRPEDVKTHPKRHMINQYWGMPLDRAPFTPYVTECIPYTPGDRYLLCSDGLTDMLTDEQIAQILAKDESVEHISQMLVHQAKLNGGRDNVTVIVVEVRDKNKEGAQKKDAAQKKEETESVETKKLTSARRVLNSLIGVLFAAELYVLLELVDLFFFV